MEKLDRLDWVAGFSFESYGVKIGVRSNSRSVLGHLEPLLPPGWRPGSFLKVDRLYSLLIGRPSDRPGVRTFNLAYGDVTRIARAANLGDVLESFESDLQLYVAESALNRIFVHAGVVEWSNRAIVIPGRSYSGKTTLVAELIRSGARFYSDEYAVFDRRGLVYPYSKPLSVRDLSGGQKKCPAETIGGQCGYRPIRVGAVIVSSFKAGAHWNPGTGSTGQGILALLANTVAARSKPDISLDAFRHSLDGAMVLTGPRGEALEAASAILGAVDAGGK